MLYLTDYRNQGVIFQDKEWGLKREAPPQGGSKTGGLKNNYRDRGQTLCVHTGKETQGTHTNKISTRYSITDKNLY